ncbi:myeloid differentiation primary response protein MyD88 isoform X2 [Anoplophora glabripennis]|nr:myeloid differentiation primary response protein MyD88 isoform X2 [Anoplophora glabripennis]
MEQHISDLNGSHDNKHITIRALRRGSRNVISTLLNPIKIIPNDKGLPRDWQGLAELCGISGEKIPSLQQDPDPSNKVLHLWSEEDKNESTIDKFIIYLEELDRFDVIEDISPLIEEDINYFKQNTSEFSSKYPDLDSDKYILTIDDVNRRSEGLEPQTYDAFVLFADDDIDFATELIETMEKQYNLKLCVKGRDLVGGGFEHDSVIKLISERCCRLIVILSPAFLDSSANQFFYSFAQAIGIEQRQRKIVPCLYKNCGKLPAELSCYVILDYERTNKLWKNFWYKLYNSIRTPEATSAVVGNVNLIRSSSQYNPSSNRCLLNPEQENPSPDSLRSLNQVKFKSMGDLDSIDNQKIMPEECMTESNSANSLGAYSEKTRNNASLYKRIKKIIKVKSTKNEETKSETPNLVTDVEINKTKKKNFFSRNKRKAALAN